MKSMKKDPNTSPQTDENKSPAMSSNKMMMSWLTKGGPKITQKTEDKPTTNKSPIKNVDSNAQKQDKTPTSKTVSSKLAKAISSDEDDEIIVRKNVIPKSAKKEKDKTTPPPKRNTKTVAKAISSDEDDEIIVTKSAKSSKEIKPAKKEKGKTTPPPKKDTKAVAKAKKEMEEITKARKELEESPGLDKKTASAKKPANKFYAAYMRREGPRNPGSKRVPIGNPNCFAGLRFLTTGVLDSLDRDECKRIIEKYGGSVISGVTKKLDYLIVGEDAGQSKLEKANELKVKQVNEDQFLELICQKSGITNPKYETSEMEMDVDEEMDVKPVEKSLSESLELKEEVVTPKKRKSDVNLSEVKTKINSESPQKTTKSSMVNIPLKTVKSSPSEATTIKKELKEPQSQAQSQLWVDKYKPTTFNKIIGQNTEKSNANKLLNWLKNWQKFHASTGEKVKKAWNDQDTGSSFKAALLSGPPGIGKTTTAHLTAKEAGYTFIEFNASDSRSKKLLDKVLGESSDSCSMDSYLKGNHKVSDAAKDKHCIIMDEVDGMAGNEDRGGIQELIIKLKNSKIPIICICNDRQHVKIRSLANYCFDLRFYKPRLEQVRAGLMSVCFKEGIKISPDVLDQIIAGCNYDIRQCLHNLSMWSSNNKVLNSSQTLKNDIEKAIKDTKMNPFEACKQVFQSDPAKPKTMIDKMDLFFTDYSLMPLLVQENYLIVKPANLKGNTKQQKDKNHLELLDQAADSICMSDRVGKQIRTYNNWSLLTTQSVFATVVPGDKISGSIGLPAFPGWFGKNSKQGRVDRILQELQKHMRLHISANKIGVGMEYLSVLKRMLSDPLIKRGTDGINDVIKIMNEYCLTRDDFDTILELGTWPGQKDPMTLIDSKVKASFTRTYNKESHKNPFSIVNIKKLKASKLNEEGEEMEDDEETVEDDDDITADAMIKVNTKPKKAAATSKAATSKTATKRAAKDDSEPASKPASKKKKT